MTDWDSERIRQIWDRLAEAWDRNRALVWRFTREVSEHLVDRLDPQPGHTILEVGTGPGDTGFLVADRLGPSGQLLCTDLSAEMLRRARAAAQRLGLSNVEFREMDAMRLELPDASVDGILGRLVYHLVPDPAHAFAEARRVLRPGGRFCFTVFGPDEEIPFDLALARTTTRQGLSLPPGITLPVDLDDEGLIRSLLAAAGFEEVEVDEVRFTLDFPDGDDAWRYVTELYGRQADLIRSLTLDEQGAFRDTLLEELAPYWNASAGYEIPTLCLNACAR